MDIQRVRNLTTNILHTKVDHIYDDFETIIGWRRPFTHELSTLLQNIKPYLERVIPEERFWDGQYDPTHTGEIEVPVMGLVDREDFLISIMKPYMGDYPGDNLPYLTEKDFIKL